jgi:hypothetical protein
MIREVKYTEEEIWIRNKYSPAVSNDPVLLTGGVVLAETNNGHNVDGTGGGGVVVENATFIIPKGVGVDGTGHRTPFEDLSLDFVHP